MDESRISLKVKVMCQLVVFLDQGGHSTRYSRDVGLGSVGMGGDILRRTS